MAVQSVVHGHHHEIDRVLRRTLRERGGGVQGRAPQRGVHADQLTRGIARRSAAVDTARQSGRPSRFLGRPQTSEDEMTLADTLPNTESTAPRLSRMAERLYGSQILGIAAEIRTLVAAGTPVCNL